MDAHITGIAPKIAGRVANVLVTDNQDVKKGELLVEIDPGDFDAQVAQRKAALIFAQANEASAQASYEQSVAHLTTLQATVEQEQAGAVASAAQAEQADADLARAQELFAKKVNTPQDLDKATATAKSDRALVVLTGKRVNGARSQLAEGQQSVNSEKAKIETARAQITQTEADLHLANLNASYARIVAPEDGRITRKAVEPGSYAQVGQTLFSLVSRDVWVSANFKENQIGAMRPGQETEVAIDALPGQEFKARVDSIQAGSGARFSLLPPENATGNYIKVVQRVPVKLTFVDQPRSDLRLGPGVSVVPTVSIGTYHFSWLAIAVLTLFAMFGTGLIFWLGLRPRPARKGTDGTNHS
jgi:membrane fusion protein (multidrug efflux system)